MFFGHKKLYCFQLDLKMLKVPLHYKQTILVVLYLIFKLTFFVVVESEMHDKDQLLAPPKPPSKRKLKRAMKLRNKEKAMSSIIWEVAVYFMYIMVLLFLCHGSRDSRGQIINQQIKTTFIETTNGLDTVRPINFFNLIIHAK